MLQSGEIVRIINLQSKPELNGITGIILRLDPISERYAVSIRPNGVASQVSLKSANIEMVNEKYFTDELMMLMPSLSSVLKSGLHVDDDIAYLDRDCKVPSGVTELSASITINYGPFALRGANRALPYVDGVWRPQCKLNLKTYQLYLNAPHGYTIEIEDIDFSATVIGTLYPISVQSGSVVFRRCRFSWNLCGLYCNGVDRTASQSVIFENCIFEGFSKYALLVEAPYLAVFLNCTFKGSNHGAIVSQGGKAEVMSCVFINQAMGIYCDHGASIRISHSLFESSPNRGIHISNCKDVVIEKSRFINCQAVGIHVEDKTVVKVEFCSIANCKMGIGFTLGKTKAEVIYSTFTNNERGAVLVGDMCVGEVTLSDNMFFDNGPADVCNCSNNDKCKVAVDGSVLLKNGENRSSEIARQQFQSNLMSNKKEEANKVLSLQRTFKTVGLVELAPQCNKCQLKEPNDKKFSKCGRCQGVVYCSKDCQQSDWADHKIVCRTKGSGIL
jgi:hypothetical protein